MLFLNQVTINGQTHYVLVDASNKPVQLPQGMSSSHGSLIMLSGLLM